MKAILTLDEKEVAEAVKRYVAQQGYLPTNVVMSATEETNIRGERTGFSVFATVTIGPITPQKD